MLEIAIQENTNALRELLEAIRGMASGGVVEGPKSRKPAGNAAATLAPSSSSTDASALRSDLCAPAAQTAAPVAETPTSVATAPEASGVTLTYQEVSDAVVEVVNKKGKDAVRALLAQFGIKNAQQASQEQWPELVAAAKKVLAA